MSIVGIIIILFILLIIAGFEYLITGEWGIFLVIFIGATFVGIWFTICNIASYINYRITSFLTGWRKIKYPPLWVDKSIKKWMNKHPNAPLNTILYLKGKTFRYRIILDAPPICYRKKRRGR